MRQLVVCRSCGHFQPAVPWDSNLEQVGDECEECASTAFLDPRPTTGPGWTRNG